MFYHNEIHFRSTSRNNVLFTSEYLIGKKFKFSDHNIFMKTNQLAGDISV